MRRFVSAIKFFTRLREVKVLVTGPTGAGKTTLIHAIDERAKSVNAPSGATIFMDVGIIIYDLKTGRYTSYVPPEASGEPNRFVKIKFIGTPGHERFRHQRLIVLSTSAKEVDVVALVVDSGDERSIEVSRNILREVSEKVKFKTLLLVANKQDLPNALPGAEIAKRLGIQEYVETSALYRRGIDNFVRKCVKLGELT